MKKVLLLVAVLAMAANAFGATASFYTTDNTVERGQSVTISVKADFDSHSIKMWQVNDNGTSGRLGMASAPVINSLYGASGLSSGINFMNQTSPSRLFATTGSASSINGSKSDYSTNGFIPANSVLWSFTYTVASDAVIGSTITIDDIAGSSANYIKQGSAITVNDITGVALTVIPEPMTMSLLALGGLVALRRRHA